MLPKCQIIDYCHNLESLKTKTPTTARHLAVVDVYFNKRILVSMASIINFLLSFLVRLANTQVSLSGGFISLSTASAIFDLPTPDIGLWLTPLFLVASEAALEYIGLTDAVLDFCR